MKPNKEKELVIALLTEKIEKLSGKKVKLEEKKDCGCGCGNTCSPKTKLKEGTWSLPGDTNKASKLVRIIKGLEKENQVIDIKKISNILYRE